LLFEGLLVELNSGVEGQGDQSCAEQEEQYTANPGILRFSLLLRHMLEYLTAIRPFKFLGAGENAVFCDVPQAIYEMLSQRLPFVNTATREAADT
jgi:hypothetical protein